MARLRAWGGLEGKGGAGGGGAEKGFRSVLRLMRLWGCFVVVVSVFVDDGAYEDVACDEGGG